jgi:hypothetical protein
VCNETPRPSMSMHCHGPLNLVVSRLRLLGPARISLPLECLTCAHDPVSAASRRRPASNCAARIALPLPIQGDRRVSGGIGHSSPPTPPGGAPWPARANCTTSRWEHWSTTSTVANSWQGAPAQTRLTAHIMRSSSSSTCLRSTRPLSRNPLRVELNALEEQADNAKVYDLFWKALS